jgi:hypothetical protein
VRLRTLQLVIACQGTVLTYVMCSLSPQQNQRNSEPCSAPLISPEPRYLRYPYLIYHIRDGGGRGGGVGAADASAQRRNVPGFSGGCSQKNVSLDFVVGRSGDIAGTCFAVRPFMIQSRHTNSESCNLFVGDRPTARLLRTHIYTLGEIRTSDTRIHDRRPIMTGWYLFVVAKPTNSKVASLLFIVSCVSFNLTSESVSYEFEWRRRTGLGAAALSANLKHGLGQRLGCFVCS